MSTVATADIKEILKSLSTIMPWLTAKPMLDSLGIITSNGWKPTIEKLSLLPKSKEYILAEKILSEIFSEHILFGEKIIRRFSLKGLPPKEISKFNKLVKKFCNEFNSPLKSKFYKTYPYPLTDTLTLKKLAGEPHELLSSHNADDKYIFQFCTVRSYRERVELDLDQFAGAKKFSQLEQFEEFFGILPTYRQCYDSVVFDPQKLTIELRLDAPKGMSVEELYLAVNHLADQFDSLAQEHFEYTPCSSSPQNLYKAIGNLYKASGEGMVYELGFTASSQSTVSNNSGKLLKGRNKDLRLDPFHLGGKNKVQDILPYRIGVEWKGSGAITTGTPSLIGNPRLYLPGTARMLNKPPCEISLAYITNCITKFDYDFVSEKLDHYLN